MLQVEKSCENQRSSRSPEATSQFGSFPLECHQVGHCRGGDGVRSHKCAGNYADNPAVGWIY